MDLVLDFCDEHVLTPYVYPSSVPEDNIYRQFMSLWVISSIGATLLYLGCSTLGYIFLFDKKLRLHKHFLKNQERLEIQAALTSVPGMGFLTAIMFVAEVRGYSKLYDHADIDEHGGWAFLATSFVTFLLFTDFLIYWIHRGLHSKTFYFLHKLHHKWKVPTPYASHAFHPIDGFAQSFPYHLYPFMFPLHKGLYLALFVFVNLWTVGIHDNDYRLPEFLQPIINGCAHHTDHHLFFNYNYGQYTTLWDRLGQSYRHPSAYEGESVHDWVDKNVLETKQGKFKGE
eukprot:TRINITY_DN6936_c0_g1_i3.p1 TRINITY_DN6936_c0_g1~~TRINITY_DN6936_c0_g1_i3.p1  ORF type:complete len:285 (+),score=38.36 TRINITY_DN6936_c0_g1_i3:336-1190(+)